MQCHICGRPHDPNDLPFLCAVDTRNIVYQSRISHLQTLLEVESLRQEIKNLLDGNANPDSSDALTTLKAQQTLSEQRTTEILDAADKLRNEIKAARDDFRAKKAEVARRKGDLDSARDGVQERRSRQLKELEKSSQMARFRWSQSAEDMASTRSFLCAEAAHLYGLKKVTKKGNKTPEYQIGRVQVVDLLAMNGKSGWHFGSNTTKISQIFPLSSSQLPLGTFLTYWLWHHTIWLSACLLRSPHPTKTTPFPPSCPYLHPTAIPTSLFQALPPQTLPSPQPQI